MRHQLPGPGPGAARRHSRVLPHGSAKDGNAARQPVFLSTTMEAPNEANVLCVASGKIAPAPEKFERILDVFDGGNAEAVAQARTRWKQYKDGGHNVTYMRQGEDGAWENAA